MATRWNRPNKMLDRRTARAPDIDRCKAASRNPRKKNSSHIAGTTARAPTTRIGRDAADLVDQLAGRLERPGVERDELPAIEEDERLVREGPQRNPEHGGPREDQRPGRAQLEARGKIDPVEHGRRQRNLQKDENRDEGRQDQPAFDRDQRRAGQQVRRQEVGGEHDGQAQQGARRRGGGRRTVRPVKQVGPRSVAPVKDRVGPEDAGRHADRRHRKQGRRDDHPERRSPGRRWHRGSSRSRAKSTILSSGVTTSGPCSLSPGIIDSMPGVIESQHQRNQVGLRLLEAAGETRDGQEHGREEGREQHEQADDFGQRLERDARFAEEDRPQADARDRGDHGGQIDDGRQQGHRHHGRVLGQRSCMRGTGEAMSVSSVPRSRSPAVRSIAG